MLMLRRSSPMLTEIIYINNASITWLCDTFYNYMVTVMETTTSTVSYITKGMRKVDVLPFRFFCCDKHILTEINSGSQAVVAHT